MNALLVPVPGALQREHLITVGAFQLLALLVDASNVVLEIELVLEAAAALLAGVGDVQVLHLEVSDETVLSAEGLGTIFALEQLSLINVDLADRLHWTGNQAAGLSQSAASPGGSLNFRSDFEVANHVDVRFWFRVRVLVAAVSGIGVLLARTVHGLWDGFLLDRQLLRDR